MIRPNRPRLIALILTTLVFIACAPLERAPANDVSAPSAGPWPHGAIVAAANPYATDAAIEILERGGSAVDAAIAAHLVLSLVEPQSSGIGGGGFLLAYDRDAGSLRVFDGRETAPAGATADMFMHDGEAMKFLDAWQSGIAIGTPGAVAMYRAAHDAHGALPWADVFQPAIALAADGFVVSPRLNNLLTRVRRFSDLDDYPDSAAYFYPGGEPLAVGAVRDNQPYAQLLREIASRGPDAFYRGAVAQAMVDAATAAPRPGTLSLDDLAHYGAAERAPVCGSFRELTMCSAPPPSSGLGVIMMAGLYERFIPDSAAADETQMLRAFVDAQRLAYADRDHFVGDPAFADVPARALLDPRYLDRRAQERFAPSEESSHGDPAAATAQRAARWQFGADTTDERGGTTHLSIVDGQGNAVVMTASVEAPFGSSRLVHGFLLNNQMTDFARDPGKGDAPANLVQPGKRSRSSMSPTIVFDADGQLLLLNGSPGGNSILAYVAKATIGILDRGLSIDEAIASPNIVARGDRVRVEIASDEGKEAARRLQEAGYDVVEREGENSGLHTILVTPGGMLGGADPRREGTVRTIPPAP